jgi:hypothetical protein
MNALPYMSLIINKQNIGYLSSYIVLNTMLNLHGFLVASGSSFAGWEQTVLLIGMLA